MLKREDNELLVRVGPGTAMGAFLRRFWIPALLSEELPEADGAPVRVGLLGEKLVAFRDTEGRVGLLDAYCPHRRAPLFFGRNEQCGLRCVYHGWKFDITGQCTDAPNVQQGEHVTRSIRTVAYPTLERGGLVWAYLGPPELEPPFPEAEVFDLPPSHRHIRKMEGPGNWFQSMEGDVDSSHVSFLHSAPKTVETALTRLSPFLFADTAPRWETEPTPYGVMLSAQRDAGPESYSWRINQWLMPHTTLVAAPRDAAGVTNIRVPIDDEHTTHFRIYARLDAPLTDADRDTIRSGIVFPELIPGTFTPKANMANDYLIDREMQKTRSYTGIVSIPAQDYAVTQDQGGLIADRSRERLVGSDLAILAVRRRILASVKALARGEEPPEARDAGAFRVRAVDVVLPRSADFREETRRFTDTGGCASGEVETAG